MKLTIRVFISRYCRLTLVSTHARACKACFTVDGMQSRQHTTWS